MAQEDEFFEGEVDETPTADEAEDVEDLLPEDDYSDDSEG